MRRLGVGAALLLTLPHALRAQDPFPSTGELIGEMIGEGFAAGVQGIIEGRIAVAQATAEIEEARRRFWTEYPSGAGLAEAATALEGLLHGKDMWYLINRGLFPHMDAVLPVLIGDVDGGIPPRATGKFDAWTGAIRDHLMRDGPIDIFALPALLPDALAATQSEYDSYAQARRWTEFLAVGREPEWVTGPETWLLMLLELDGPYDREGAVEAYRGYVERFGEDRVLRFGAAARSSPETRLSELYEQMRADVAAEIRREKESDPRTYVTWLFERQTGATPGSASDDYDRWVAVYGEPTVGAAISRLLQAPRSGDRLADPEALGLPADVTSTYMAFGELLMREGAPASIVKIHLAFANRVTTAAEVDALYRTYVDRYGADGLERAVATMVANGDHIYVKGPAILEDYVAGRRDLVEAAPIINPSFVAWSGFAPGATVTYVYKANRTPPSRVTQTLREVSMAREANVLLVSSYHGRGPDAEEYSLPGRQVRFGSYWPLFLNQLDRYRAQGFRPSDFIEDTGEETIIVAGRSVAARWWRLVATDGVARETPRWWTLWLSEEVPGGLARVEETTGRSGPGAVVVSTVEVEAFAGQRTGANTLFADFERVLSDRPR